MIHYCAVTEDKSDLCNHPYDRKVEAETLRKSAENPNIDHKWLNKSTYLKEEVTLGSNFLNFI